MIFDKTQTIKVTFVNGRQVWISKHSKQIEYDLVKQYGSAIKSISGLKKSKSSTGNKKPKTGRAWQKDHHNYNPQEKHERKPADRKKPARNVEKKKLSKGGKLEEKDQAFYDRVDQIMSDYNVSYDTAFADAKEELGYTPKHSRSSYGSGGKTGAKKHRYKVTMPSGHVRHVDALHADDAIEQTIAAYYLIFGKVPKNKFTAEKVDVKQTGGEVAGALPTPAEMRSAFKAGKLVNPATGKVVTDREEMYRMSYLADLAANPAKYAMKEGGEVPSKRKRRTKAEMMQARYEELVDTYKFFIVDLEQNRAIDGYEYKEDAVETMEGDIGKYPSEQKTHKVMALSSLKAAGIEDPRQRWKEAGKEIGDKGLGGFIMPLLTLYIGYKIGRFRPQKRSFETEKKIAGKAGAAAKRTGKAIGKTAEKLADQAQESFAARAMGNGGKVPKGFTRELETDEFIYYTNVTDFGETEQVIMIRKSDGEIASDNYFAENDLYERMVEIANGREQYVYMRPSSKKYLKEYKE